MAKVCIFLIIVALIAGMTGCGPIPPPTPPSQNLEIRTWYDLDAVRDNLGGNHTLMNDLDSTTPGYEELASPTANQGKGWQPIGTWLPYSLGGFWGTFDGQGYEIRDLFINRPDESDVGLFGVVDGGGVIKDIGVVNVTVTGGEAVGGLAGGNHGTVSDSYSSGSVTGDGGVGGLVGSSTGTVSNSYSTGNVIGNSSVGGLVGWNEGTVSNSHFTGNVTSEGSYVGGLMGLNVGPVDSSYSTGTVTGSDQVGGLVGSNWGTVSNSYSTGNVIGSCYVGGLVGYSRGCDTVSNSYSTGNVAGDEYVGGLVGSNGDRVTVSNSYSTGSVTGAEHVGGLVGENEGEGTVSNSFWDTETSGQATSDGGTGKTTAQMKSIATFSGAGWNIGAVANPGTRNPSYIWNIVNGVTYPFLSWQS